MLGTVDITSDTSVEPEKKKSEAEQNLTEVKKTAKKPIVPQEKENLDVGYSIQLGSFNNAANVNALVKKLRQYGFTAYTIPKRPIDKHLTKVFVGPNISKSKLQNMQKEIEKLTKLKGKIVSFDPVEQ